MGIIKKNMLNINDVNPTFSTTSTDTKLIYNYIHIKLYYTFKQVYYYFNNYSIKCREYIYILFFLNQNKINKILIFQ